ncbi:MAG: hypothetical protein EOL95_08065 [Bacteroidia bacterium]|nr:hypothetical protein [Bacteroidia bacterium]
MKELFHFYRFVKLCVLLCAVAVASVAEAQNLKNNVIPKTDVNYGDLICGSNLSIADNEETTDKTHFTIPEVYVYMPTLASLNLNTIYSEGYSNWSNGGSTTAPKYAILSNPQLLKSSYPSITDGVNRLIVHTPQSQKEIATFKSSGHKAGTPLYVRMTVRELTGNSGTSKIAVKLNGYGVYQQITGNQTIEISQYIDDAATIASDKIELIIAKDNYNGGDDFVFAISDVVVMGEPQGAIASSVSLGEDNRYGVDERITVNLMPMYQGKYIQWQISSNGTDWANLEGYNQTEFDYSPDLGASFFRALVSESATDPVLVTSNTLMVSRFLACSPQGQYHVLFEDNFGTLASETARACRPSEVPNYTCRSDENSNVEDGAYAVVANPHYAGQDNRPAQTDADYWFRNIYDHTQGGVIGGEYGGMLLINGGTNLLVYTKTFTNPCLNTRVNFSAWFANADWDRGRGESHDMDVVIVVLDENGVEIPGAEISVTGTKEEGWKHGVVSFDTGTNAQFTIQIKNSGTGGGYDTLIDDVVVSTCSPDASLFAVGVEENPEHTVAVECGDEVTLEVDKTQIEQIFTLGAYYLWLTKDESSEYAIDVINSGFDKSSCEFTVEGLTYHKVLIASSELSATNYFNGIVSPDLCEVVAETNEETLRCDVVTISYTRSCNIISLTAATNTDVVTWQKSVDGETWVDMPETEKNITVNITEDSYFKVSNAVSKDSTDVIPVQSIRLYTTDLDEDEAITLGSSATLETEVKGMLLSTYKWYMNDQLESDQTQTTYNVTDLYKKAIYKVEGSDCVSNELTVNVKWPTAFMPYDNGTNKDFARGFAIQVHDRYGNKVAEGSDGWDGTCKGKMSMPGVYYYVVTLPDGDVIKGTIELVKKNK